LAVYIEIEKDDYKFHICEPNQVVRLEDKKVNIIVIKINWNV
jgi:hypothetical protein